jgi:hypothetical protein
MKELNFKNYLKSVGIPMFIIFIGQVIAIMFTKGFCDFIAFLTFVVDWIGAIIVSYFLTKWAVWMTDPKRKVKVIKGGKQK